MTVLEFIRKRRFYKSHFVHGNGPRRHMFTKDGTEISIQRGKGIHSSPSVPEVERYGHAMIQHFSIFDYDVIHDSVVDSVEVGLYGNKLLTPDSELMEYCSDPKAYLEDEPNDEKLYTFDYVPLYILEKFIKQHGGYDHIDTEETKGFC